MARLRIFTNAPTARVDIGMPVSVLTDRRLEARIIKGLLKIDDWNTMKIRAVGPEYTVWLNGKKVLHYTSEKVPVQGPIGLQLHGNKVMKIAFRDLKVIRLLGY